MTRYVAHLKTIKQQTEISVCKTWERWWPGACHVRCHVRCHGTTPTEEGGDNNEIEKMKEFDGETFEIEKRKTLIGRFGP